MLALFFGISSVARAQAELEAESATPSLLDEINPLRESDGAQSDPSTSGGPPGPAAPGQASNGNDNEATTEKSALPSREELSKLLQALEEGGLDEEDRSNAAAALRRAIELTTALEQQQAQLAHYREEIPRSPVRVKERREKLAQPPAEPSGPPEEIVTKALEEGLLEREKRVTKWRDDLARFQAMQTQRAARRAAIPDEIAKAERQLQDAAAGLAGLRSQEGGNALTSALRQARLYEVEFFSAQLQALKAEDEYKKTGAEALQLNIDVISRELAVAETEFALWRDALKSRRESDAEKQAVEAARQAAVVRAPALEAYAQSNASLADEAKSVTSNLGQTTDRLTSAKSRLDSLKKEFESSQARVEAAGLTTESGKLLRKKQAELPDVRDLRRRKDSRSREESRVTFRLYELNDQRSELANLDQSVELVLREVGSDTRTDEVRSLLESRRTYLENLTELYQDYSSALSRVAVTEAELIVTSDQYADFIAQRVLWIRSCDTPQWTDARAAYDAGRWILDPRNWRQAAASLGDDAGRRPLLLGALACGLAVLALAQRKARAHLIEMGEVARKRTCIQFRPTLRASWLTLVIALPWPYLLFSLGWLLDTPLEESEFVRSLAIAARLAAVCLLLFEIIRQLCRRGGLADAHFDWSDAALGQLRRQSRWLNVLALPLVAVVAGMETQNDPHDYAGLWSPSLGRFAFVTLMALVGVTLYRLLIVDGSPFRQLIMRHDSDNWLAHLQKAWRPLVALLPVFLAALALSGYYYSAQQAALRILEAIFLLAGVAVLGGLVRRWLLVNQRGIAREQARQRRAQLAAAAAQEGEGAPSPNPESPPEETIDLAALGEQTLKLVRLFLGGVVVAGLLAIFARLLPALAFVGSYAIWPGVIDLAWGQLLLFIVAIGCTYVAARDLPALVELTLLKLFSFDSGARYALTSLSRYVLMAAGAVMAAASLGIAWSQVQWLIAAMSVGLGFGLQEIFANFVSGIILLFERPIRVGDVVTLGDKTGVVNRIRIRATTLVDWDRKEYVIPNKDLVTGSLLNWTLSDHTNRVVVNVGIAYGGDTDRACKLLRDIAWQHPQVLRDPEPVATFQEFGDSSLNLVLRCYLPSLEHRLATIHELHTAIHKRFAEAAIEIPFPQRDLHIRSGVLP